MRRSRGVKFWEKVIKDQQRSGLSQSRFCRERNLTYATFQYWKSKLGKEAFIELPVIASPPPSPSPSKSGELALTLPGGASLTITW